MPHVDEGTLHALLDGELETSEVHRIQTHFATCPACAARLDEAKHLLAETERLVTALEAPVDASREEELVSTGAAAGVPASGPRPAAAPPPPPPGEGGLETDPFVLIPDNPGVVEQRRRRARIVAWAAGFIVIVGASLYGLRTQTGVGRSKQEQQLRLRPEDFTAAPPPQPAAPQRTVPNSADSLTLATLRESAPAPAPTAAAPAAPESKRDDKTPAGPATTGRERAAGQVSLTDARADTSEDRSTLAARAAKATADLDRQKIRDKAAAATAALDAAKRRDAEAAQLAAARTRAAAPAAEPTVAANATGQAPTPAAPAPAPAPAPVPPSYPRIGLDEAARELGSPLHAIDAAGLTRQTVLLVPGNVVAGADTSRPVVRAVYKDASGRLIFLDQQRVSAGQAAGVPSSAQASRSEAPRWVAGSVLIHLHGDATPDFLKSLAERVR